MISQEREDIEKSRKLLGRRKPSIGADKKNKTTKEPDGFLRPADKQYV